ncbi:MULTISPECIES: hypothetical protein [unclassified Paenibacillus]|uniref:hypothetical protein n=1 Tax=unclassified Paenibacillus TaxID=185978 RepID=UPI0003E29D72|nr:MULTISPECIES: hypothetical protein [unclassified Paenibacillus]ETT32153.1 hypothetical protein C169_24125 [Paenibacillus sp. FSL R5-808]
MPNDAGRYSKEEVIASGLPYYIPKSKRWTHTPYPFAILISKSRCERFGMPILGSGREKPSAFLYSASAGTGTDDKKHRYIPLYDRTSALSGDESIRLYPHEIMKQGE